MELTIIMPVYNEKNTIREIICRVRQANSADTQIIVVDDCSLDGTREVLKELEEEGVEVYYHRRNMGKGAAVRTGFSHAKGTIMVIQDADLEYDPKEIPQLIRPIQDGVADAVYGSRLTGGKPQRVHMFWHKVGNTVITLFGNFLYNSTLTDLETCYKAFRRDFMKGITIRSNGFAIEPELTAKILKRKARLYEMPISYYGRNYEEGKKIRFYHGFEALWTLLKYRFVD